MSFISRYMAYLKRNPEGYWFKSKVYGWGWFPARWQGWFSLLAMVAVLGWMIVRFTHHTQPNTTDTLWFLLRVAVWAGALILLCYLTGEPLRWQWGIPEEK